MTDLRVALRLGRAKPRGGKKKRSTRTFTLRSTTRADSAAQLSIGRGAVVLTVPACSASGGPAAANSGGALARTPASAASGRASVRRSLALGGTPASSGNGRPGAVATAELASSPGLSDWSTAKGKAASIDLEAAPSVTASGVPSTTGGLSITVAPGVDAAARPRVGRSIDLALPPQAVAVGSGAPGPSTFSDGTLWSDGTGWI